jgi:endonuclease G, mitochondrial
MKVWLFVSINLILSAISYTQQSSVAQKEDSIRLLQQNIAAIEARLEDARLMEVQKDLRANGLPALMSNQMLIEHKAYFLVYSEQHEQALWVAHKLTQDVLGGTEGRTNDFRPDSLIKTGSAVEADYFLKEKRADGSEKYDGFGFDRGHLAPSADFRWSKKALSESYLYSNMSPQRAEFNRDSWAKLEDKFRAYIARNAGSSLYIVTGPVLNDSLPKIERGVNHVSIPHFYYKLAVDLEKMVAIAFLMPNEKASYGYSNYAFSIDEIEQLTGIDYYASLPDSVENKLEALSDPAPFLTASELKDVEPIFAPSLPKNHFNTVQAELYMGQNKKVTVCGTVVSAKKSSKGNVFLNLDRQFPNQLFTVSIFANQAINFSYNPEELLVGKQICVTGIITNYNGKPSMEVGNEKAIEFYQEIED